MILQRAAQGLAKGRGGLLKEIFTGTLLGGP